MSTFQKMNNDSVMGGQKVSTGHKFLDFILGRGMAIGSIILLEEDKYVVHANMLSRYFLAEGIQQKQPILAACLDKDPRQILQSIPAPGDEANKESQSGEMSEEMRIAWRYNSLPKFDSSEQFNPNATRNYDLSKKIKLELLEQNNILYWDGEDEMVVTEKCLFTNERYQSLLTCIHKKLLKESKNNKNIVRISLSSFGSPVWYETNMKNDLLKFMMMLKALIKNSSAVCFITFPGHLFEDTPKFVNQIRNLADFVFELKSINHADDIRSIYKEYTGLFYIRKLSAVNTLANTYQGTFDLAYKITRRDFVIETFHLPPDIPESDDKNNSSVAEIPSISCGSTSKHLLEF